MYICKLTADDWQLFVHLGPEKTDNVADKLNEAVTNAVRKVIADPATPSQWGALQARDEVYKVMDKHRDFGTRDTEPEGVLCAELEKALGLGEHTVDRC